MNRTELVKTIAQKAEVPFSEGELLTDIFFRKLSSDEIYDNISIPGIGSVKITRDEYNSTSFHFVDQEKYSLTVTGENTPVQYPRFSLSLGKPVFPLKGRSDNVIRLNPDETLNMIESRAEKIYDSVLQLSVRSENENIIPENTDNALTESLLKDISDFSNEEDFAEIPAENTSDFKIPDDLQDGIFDELTDSTLDEINEVLFGESEITLPEEQFNASLQDEDLISQNDEYASSDEKEVKEYESFADISLDEITAGTFENFSELTSDEFPGAETAADNKFNTEDNDLINDQNFSIAEPLPTESSSPDELIISEPLVRFDDEIITHEPLVSDNEVFLSGVLIASDDEAAIPEMSDSLEALSGYDKEVNIPLTDLKDENIASESLIDSAVPDVAEENYQDQIQDLISGTEAETQLGEDQHAEITSEFLAEPGQQVTAPENPDQEISVSEADDFSEDIKNIIETARETDNVPAEKENIVEEDESSFSELVAGSIPEETDHLTDDNNKNEIFPVVTPLDLSEKPAAEISEEKKNSGEFQRVKSLTREFFHIPQQEQKLSWEFGESEQIEKAIKAATRAFEEIPPADEKKDGFRPVKSTKTTMEWAPGSFPEPSSGSEDLFDDSGIEPSDFKEDKEPFIKETKSTRSKKESVVKKKSYVNENFESQSGTFSTHRRNKKKNTSFIIIAGFLALILLAVIAYYKFFQTTPPKGMIVKEPVIIERNDQVPVMVQQPQDQEQIISVPPEGEEEITRISQGIYSRNNLIYIQVSSWQTMSKARREAERFEQMGHKTEIQKSLLGAAVWYRVLVGEFNSPEEAAEFRNQN